MQERPKRDRSLEELPARAVRMFGEHLENAKSGLKQSVWSSG